MQDVVSNVNNVKFDIEVALEQQLGAQPLPFPGMDSEYIWLAFNFKFSLPTTNTISINIHD